MAKKSYPSNLVVLLKIDGACLNHKIFRRFLIELEVIVSTKPITSRSLLVVHSSVALYHCSCIVLIAMESRFVMLSRRQGQRSYIPSENVYSKKLWRRV